MRRARAASLALSLMVACWLVVSGLGGPARAVASAERFAARVDARPEASQDRFAERLDARLPAWLAEYRVPGAAIAVVRAGAVAWTRGYGWADAPGGTPVTADTVFQVASVSKAVSAWGVMRLVQDGRLALDAPIERYLTRWHLPASPHDASGVTVRRLLSHTEGLSIPGYFGFAPDEPLPTLEASLDGMTHSAGAGEGEVVRLVQPPGQGVRYSGGGYTLLQLLVEEVSGQPFAAYMQDAVLDPLEMSGSSFEWTPALQSVAATGHGADEQPFPDYRYTELAAAGLNSTAGSLARWVAAGLVGPAGETPGRGVLTPATVRAMFAPQSATAGRLPTAARGLGYALEQAPKGPRWVWHPGSNRGWQAYFAALPDRGDGLVVLTNSDNGSGLIQAVARAWGEALGVGPPPTVMVTE